MFAEPGQAGRDMMTVPIRTSRSLRIGTPVPLFEVDARRPWLGFDVSPAGRFLTIVSETRANEQPLTVVPNWSEELTSARSHALTSAREN